MLGAIFSKAVAGSGLVAGLGGYLGRGSGLEHRTFAGWYDRLCHQSACELGPRIAHALLPVAGKGPSGWSYVIVPVRGTLIGAGLAGIVLRAIRL